MRDEIMRLADIIGKNGAEPTESDRITFEAWMRGHCWAVEGEWTGKTYKHSREESGDYVHAGAMNTRRLFAAWRDRRALDEAIAARTDHVEDKLGMVPEGWRDDVNLAAQMLTWGFDGEGLTELQEQEISIHAKKLFAMLAAAPAPDHFVNVNKMVPIKPGNWPEDSSHENGNYECKCCHCGATFYGHKRRVTCKVCASPAPDHSAGVGEMVSSRHREPCWTCGGKAGESTQRKFMFACAECFRDAQPADADGTR